MKTAVIMIGIQASGKSAFCRKGLPDSLVRISLDELNTRNKEKNLLTDCISKGLSIVIDNTNPRKEDRQRYIPILKKNEYRIVGYFMQSRIADCISRNKNRSEKDRVPDIAIAATSNKLELPEYAEGFDELYFVRFSDNDFVIEKWEE
ncbi:MAG: AAA family ATPase [Lachnospiraceae bacterium]|nr:AAA family ATPase [Lachnospiraceae bacterium]